MLPFMRNSNFVANAISWLYTRNLIIFNTICTHGTLKSALSLYIIKQVISREETQKRDQQSLPLCTVSYFLCATLG